MPHTIDVELSGNALQLLGDRGVYWPAEDTLFVADLHLGKEATFRRHGIPLPTGSTQGSLQRLEGMMQATGAGQVVVLGDLFHARSSLSDSVCGDLAAFFVRNPGIRYTLVRGNHDTHVGRLPTDWPIEVVEPGQRMQRVALGHHPTELPADSDLLLCGHLHPAVRLGLGQQQLGKLPCFWLSEDRLVLPAMGEFTGTLLVRPVAGDRVWVVVGEQLIEHPVGRSC